MDAGGKFRSIFPCVRFAIIIMERIGKKNESKNRKIICPNCRGNNIRIDIVQVGGSSSGKSEVRKKSVITRTGNKIGRGAMTLMTGGLWALTPKKSDYTERSVSSTFVTNEKICLCQDCGNSWYI